MLLLPVYAPGSIRYVYISRVELVGTKTIVYVYILYITIKVQ